MAQHLRCQLHLRRQRLVVARHAFGHADCMDRHKYMSRICHSDDGLAFLRHVLVRHIRRAALTAFRHHLQPSRHQGFALVARHRTAPPAACRVRQVRYGAGSRQTDEHLRLQHTALERLCCGLRRSVRAHALHRGSARNGFGASLPHLLPHVLPRRHAWQHTLHGRSDGGLLRCGHQVRGHYAFRHAYIGGQVRRAATCADIRCGHGVQLCAQPQAYQYYSWL